MLNGPPDLPPSAPRTAPHQVCAAPSLFPVMGSVAAFLQLNARHKPFLQKGTLLSGLRWLLSEIFLLLSLPRVLSEA